MQTQTQRQKQGVDLHSSFHLLKLCPSPGIQELKMSGGVCQHPGCDQSQRRVYSSLLIFDGHRNEEGEN